jgi:hypothetical protein
MSSIAGRSAGVGNIYDVHPEPLADDWSTRSMSSKTLGAARTVCPPTENLGRFAAMHGIRQSRLLGPTMSFCHLWRHCSRDCRERCDRRREVRASRSGRASGLSRLMPCGFPKPFASATSRSTRSCSSTAMSSRSGRRLASGRSRKSRGGSLHPDQILGVRNQQPRSSYLNLGSLGRGVDRTAVRRGSGRPRRRRGRRSG